MLPECLALRSRCIPEIEASSSAPDNSTCSSRNASQIIHRKPLPVAETFQAVALITNHLNSGPSSF
jgi:hypothetical protein